MRKFTKICLITTGILILTGAIFLGSGLAIDGTSAAFGAMSAVKKHCKNLWGNSETEQFTYSFSADDGDWDEDDRDEDDWDEHDHWTESCSTSMEDGIPYDYDYNRLSCLEIDITAAELVIEPSTEPDRIRFIAEYKSTSDTILLTDNGKDSISLSSEKHHIVGNPTVKITIQIPDDYEIDSLDLELSAGNVHSSAKLQVGEADICVDAGNLSIANMIASEMEIENDAGNTELTLPGTAKDYNYELSCSLGRIEFDGKSKNGFEKSYVQNNQADRDVSIECAAGNISVDFQ
ncbi:MAG: DUF4097 family beta strand repeat-containing protein [Lachnospiraceae bacterium]